MVWCPDCNLDRSTKRDRNNFICCDVCGLVLFDRIFQGFVQAPELKMFNKIRTRENPGPRHNLFARRTLKETSEETSKEGQTKEISKKLDEVTLQDCPSTS